MSATANIVTGQAQGVTLPTDALTAGGSGDTVQLYSGGKTTTQSVTVGLRGTSRAVITNGLKAGKQVQVTVSLPALGTSSTSTTSTTSSPFGSSGVGGGGFPGGGGSLPSFAGGGAP
jgi:macrolide-specific efflux system membrane fusion protein